MSKHKIIFSDAMLSVAGLLASLLTAYIITTKADISVYGEWMVVSTSLPLASILILDIDQLFLNDGDYQTKNTNLLNYLTFKSINLIVCVLILIGIANYIFPNIKSVILAILIGAFIVNYTSGTLANIMFYFNEIRPLIYLPTTITLLQNIFLIVTLQWTSSSLLIFALALLFSNILSSGYLIYRIQGVKSLVRTHLGDFEPDWIRKKFGSSVYLSGFKWVSAQKFNSCLTVLAATMGSEVAGAFSAILKLPNLFLMFIGKIYQPFMNDFIQHKDDLSKYLANAIGKLLILAFLLMFPILLTISNFYETILQNMFNYSNSLDNSLKSSIVLILLSYVFGGLATAISVVKIPKVRYLYLILVVDYFPIFVLFLVYDLSFQAFFVVYAASIFFVVIIHTLVQIIQNKIMLFMEILPILVTLPFICLAFFVLQNMELRFIMISILSAIIIRIFYVYERV